MSSSRSDPAARRASTALQAAQAAVVACEDCLRLRAYCACVAREKKAAHRDETYWGRPVPGFGDPEARVLVVGLAPAAHGANRTGRMFTGDGTGGSGDFLMAAMHRAGMASGPTSRRADDGLALRGAFILAAVRCAPPDNKPLPSEIVSCRRHLRAEVAALPHVRVVVALGRIAWDAYLGFLAGEGQALPRPRPRFGHGAVARLPGRPILLGSYHPSRQNTHTGKLTPPMLAAIFARARALARASAR